MKDLKKILAPFRPILRFREPLARHTSFRIGGPADAFARPRMTAELTALLEHARVSGLPVFVIGAGANILAADKGIRGLVVSLERFRDCEITGTTVKAGAGVPASLLAARTARAGLQGLERFFRMPGSVGGSVWMNARCYESSFADRLVSVTVLDRDVRLREIAIDASAFGYKKSPFQTDGGVILSASFNLSREKYNTLLPVMREIERDRRAKGHFNAPSAGSVFKNNRAFGEPTGRLLDALGLRGRRSGGAQFSPLHANIIVNRRRATATDVKALIALAEHSVKKKYGFTLERELICVGEE
jgi:UDP-N-acetylmuramate dehydrogenase